MPRGVLHCVRRADAGAAVRGGPIVRVPIVPPGATDSGVRSDLAPPAAAIAAPSGRLSGLGRGAFGSIETSNETRRIQAKRALVAARYQSSPNRAGCSAASRMARRHRGSSEASSRCGMAVKSAARFPVSTTPRRWLDSIRSTADSAWLRVMSGHEATMPRTARSRGGRKAPQPAMVQIIAAQADHGPTVRRHRRGVTPGGAEGFLRDGVQGVVAEVTLFESVMDVSP